MAIERTLSIIKPDAVAKNVIGQIYARFEGAGLKVIAARMTQLSRAQAEASIQEYIEIFYNRQRRHSRLGNIAPARFAEQFNRKLRAA